MTTVVLVVVGLVVALVVMVRNFRREELLLLPPGAVLITGERQHTHTHCTDNTRQVRKCSTNIQIKNNTEILFMSDGRGLIPVRRVCM